MLQKIRKSLKLKLLVLFLAMNLAGILLVGLISYQSKRTALREQVENNLSVISVELADKVDRYLSERQNDTNAIALHYSLYGVKTTTSGQNRILASYLRIYPYYEHINIINIEDMRMPDREPVAAVGYDKAWYMSAIKGEAVSSDMFMSPLSDRPTMAFAAPIKDENGRVVSILTTNLKLDYLWSIVDQVRLENRKGGLTGYAFILNNDSLIIAHPKTEKILAEKVRDNPDSDIKALAADMTAGRSGTANVVYEGAAKTVAFAPCNGYGGYKGHRWSLAVTYPHSELYAPLKPLLFKYIMLFFVTSLLVLFISTKLADYIVKPVLTLKDGAAKIGSGNFNLRVEPRTVDEIGDLAKSFNGMAETLEVREEELRKLEVQKADFMAMLSHDIKSPLSTVITYSELVLNGTIQSGGEDLKKAVSSIHASGYKILSLVDNFLVSSAVEAGRLRLNMRPLDVNDFVDDEIPFFAPRAYKKNIQLDLVKAHSLPKVMADKMQLDRAFSNIVSNAIKYTGTNGRISIITSSADGFVSISVKDTGRGIAGDEVKKLFQKYERTKGAGKEEGLGLGLYITKAVVEAHGGDITVESSPGEGSAFTIKLPCMAMPADGPVT